MMGPNVRRLIATAIAREAIPPGGGVGDGLRFLMDPVRVVRVTREATQWVTQALELVKGCPDNPYGDEEAIAGAILERLEAKKARMVRKVGQ